MYIYITSIWCGGLQGIFSINYPEMGVDPAQICTQEKKEKKEKKKSCSTESEAVALGLAGVLGRALHLLKLCYLW